MINWQIIDPVWKMVQNVISSTSWVEFMA